MLLKNKQRAADPGEAVEVAELSGQTVKNPPIEEITKAAEEAVSEEKTTEKLYKCSCGYIGPDEPCDPID